MKSYQELIRQFNLEEHRGASIDQLKEIQLQISSSYGLGLNEKIYRVIDIGHFINDLKNNIFTLPQISLTSWGIKSCENPLSRMKYTMEDGTKFAINTNDYFGSCWSPNQDPDTSFREFGSDRNTVRIESTVRQVLSGLMNINDRFYSLHYHVGPVIYKDEKEIDQWFKDQPYDVHLDSAGKHLVQSLLILPNHFGAEKEARFIYLYQTHDNEWVKNNVKIEITSQNQLLCRHPFIWDDVVNSITFDTRMDSGLINQTELQLKSFGLNVFRWHYFE